MNRDERHLKMNMVAKTFWGLENVLAEELKQLGADQVKAGNRAVFFKGNLPLLYRINLWSRISLRVLCEIHTFHAKNEKDLYKGVQDINWDNHLDASSTLAVDSVVNSDFFNHSHYVSLKTKDAIVDQFRDKVGRRPSVDLKSPDVRVHIHINKNHCTLLLDSSGDALYKRGYRKATGAAPLNEVLAAGLIALTRWKGNAHFVDPMCGSATLLCEAALLARRFAPGLLRKSFGFMHWHNFDSSVWNRLKQEAEKLKKDTPYKFVGSDHSAKVLQAAAQNIEQAELDEYISLSKKAFEDKTPPPALDHSIVMVNPPYGERLVPQDVIDLHKRFGDALKQKYTGYEAWILSGNKEAIARVGLRTFRKYTVFNGSIQCKFHGYQLFKGDWKAKQKTVQ